MTEDATRALRVPIPYAEACELQERIRDRRASGALPDLLWLLEHPPTVTYGTRGGDENHLLLPAEEYDRRAIEVFPSSRGGDATYHEPGQLVGYPVVRLAGADRDLHEYLRRIESALIRLVADYGLRGQRVPERTGVWTVGGPGEDSRKIAALGVRARGWVTTHGFALNVDNPMSGFETIIPCGIRDAGVTSLRRELGEEAPLDWADIRRSIHSYLEAEFERPLRLVIGSEARTLA